MDITTDNAIKQMKIALRDGINHYFAYRVDGDKRLKLLSLFLDMMRQSVPHVFFTEQSLKDFYKPIKDDSDVYQMFMNMTLCVWARLPTSANDDLNIINHLVLSADVTAVRDPGEVGEKARLMPDEWTNRHAKREEISLALRNNRYVLMFYAALLYLPLDDLANMWVSIAPKQGR
jgi:hypothetical protein